MCFDLKSCLFRRNSVKSSLLRDHWFSVCGVLILQCDLSWSCLKSQKVCETPSLWGLFFDTLCHVEYLATQINNFVCFPLLCFHFSLPCKSTNAQLLTLACLLEGSCTRLWFIVVRLCFVSSCMCVEGCSRLKVIIVAVSENSPSRCCASLSLEALRTFCETAGSLPHAHSLLNKHTRTHTQAERHICLQYCFKCTLCFV